MNKRVTAEAIKEYVLDALGLKITQYKDDIAPVTNEYTKVRDIQLEPDTHNIIFVTSVWLNGEPMGLQLKNTWGVVALSEPESGFPSICFSIVGAGSLEIYQKLGYADAPQTRIITTIFTTKI